MRVSEIAKALNVSADTIRYYTRIGLVSPAKNDSGYKDYSEKDFRKLRFVIRAKSLGFSLADIKTLIEISDHGETPCPMAREVISRNLEEMSQSIEESLALFERMKQAVNAWQDMPDQLPDGEMICHLIEEFIESVKEVRL